jgi:hypothetical protein
MRCLVLLMMIGVALSKPLHRHPLHNWRTPPQHRQWLLAALRSGIRACLRFGTRDHHQQQQCHKLIALSPYLDYDGPGPSGTCGQENCGAACPLPAFPEQPALPVIAKLNDPFTYQNGSKAQSKDDWICRRAEINDFLQHYELGEKPGAPTQVRQAVTITAGDGRTSISWMSSVSLPRTGQAPYPVMIGIGGVSLNTQAIQNQGVAIITFPNNDIAQVGWRGRVVTLVDRCPAIPLLSRDTHSKTPPPHAARASSTSCTALITRPAP